MYRSLNADESDDDGGIQALYMHIRITLRVCVSNEMKTCRNESEYAVRYVANGSDGYSEVRANDGKYLDRIRPVLRVRKSLNTHQV